jgi:hypothetical protein
MTFARKGVSVAVLVLLALVPQASDGAVAGAPPPAFQVATVDGVPTGSDRLPRQGRWLLVYVQPDCFPCESFLELFKQDQPTTLPQKIVVVVGGTVADARGVRATFPDLAQASWYADTLNEAFGHLQLQGTPVMLGLRQDVIEWDLTGVPADSRTMRSIVNSWLQE